MDSRGATSGYVFALMPSLTDIADLIEETAPAVLGVPRRVYEKSKPHQAVYARGHCARLYGSQRTAPYGKRAASFANAFMRGWDAAESWLATRAGRMWLEDRNARNAFWRKCLGGSG